MADSPLLTKSKAFALDIIRVCNEIKRRQKESIMTNLLREVIALAKKNRYRKVDPRKQKNKSDIFNEYILRFPDKINIENAYKKPIITRENPKKTENNEKIIKKVNISLSKEAEIVYNYLDKQIFLPEEILNTGLTAQQLLSALTELEMEFLIEAMPGGRYRLLQ